VAPLGPGHEGAAASEGDRGSVSAGVDRQSAHIMPSRPSAVEFYLPRPDELHFSRSRKSVLQDWFDQSPMAADEADVGGRDRSIDASGDHSDRFSRHAAGASQKMVLDNVGPRANPLLRPHGRTKVLSSELRHSGGHRGQVEEELEERESTAHRDAPVHRPEGMTGEAENESTDAGAYVSPRTQKALRTNLRSRVALFEGLHITSSVGHLEKEEDKERAIQEAEGFPSRDPSLSADKTLSDKPEGDDV